VQAKPHRKSQLRRSTQLIVRRMLPDGPLRASNPRPATGNTGNMSVINAACLPGMTAVALETISFLASDFFLQFCCFSCSSFRVE
jgi:hypothetical protein